MMRKDPDEDFEDRHHCTDWPCCVIFALAVAAAGVLIMYGYQNGDVHKLVCGFDSQGRQCGRDVEVLDKPFLYYCPQAAFTALTDVVIDSNSAHCVQSCPTSESDTVPACTIGSNAYPTHEFLGAYCIPNAAVENARAAVDSQIALYAQAANGFEEVQSNWRTLLLVFVAAVVLGYLYLFLLKLVAGCLIWICVIVSMLAFIGSGIYLFMQADMIATHMEHPLGDNSVLTIQCVAGVLVALGFAVACLACCCGHQMELSIACVEAGTDVMWENPTLLLSPMIKAAVKVFFAIFLLTGFILIWSLAEVSPGVLHRHFEFSEREWGCIIFYILVSYWILEFITALYQFSIAFCVAEYYYTAPEPGGEDTDRDTGHCSALQGCFVGLQKHAGSLAFGAFLVAVLETIQKILAYMEKQNQEHGDNPVIKCVLGCLLCCVACCEEVVKAVNKMAYIDIAVDSDSFCAAVHNVMRIFVNYGAAIAILNGATLIFQIVGSCVIVAACTVLAEYVLTGGAFDALSITLLVACGLALMVAWSFMSVFDMTTDTLLYCFAHDKENNHGQTTTAPEAMRHLFDEAEEHVAGDKDHGYNDYQH